MTVPVEPEHGEELLRTEAAGLDVDDILALCYSLKHRPQRLRLYLDILRQRGGERAQFASCLICFDLARQGDDVLQREFALLAGTVRQLAAKTALVEALLGDDPYLSFIWELCEAGLDDTDPRFESEPAPAPMESLASIDLISDDDFGDVTDFELELDIASLERRFDDEVEAFLDGHYGLPIYNPDAGFRVSSRKDVDRVEKFLQALESLREHVPHARGFRALTLLFYGTHMRSKSFFGTINQRKETLIRMGLKEFIDSGAETWRIAGVLDSIHAEPEVWKKISEVIVDYAAWLAEDPRHVHQGPDGYQVINRLLHRESRRRSRR